MRNLDGATTPTNNTVHQSADKRAIDTTMGSKKRKLSSLSSPSMDATSLAIMPDRKRKQWSFDMLCSDVVVYILSMQNNYYYPCRGERLNEFFGRFSDGSIRALCYHFYVGAHSDSPFMELTLDYFHQNAPLLKNAQSITVMTPISPPVIHRMHLIAPVASLHFNKANLIQNMHQLDFNQLAINNVLSIVKTIHVTQVNHLQMFLTSRITNLFVEKCSFYAEQLQHMLTQCNSKSLSFVECRIKGKEPFPLQSIANNPSIVHFDCWKSKAFTWHPEHLPLNFPHLRSFHARLTPDLLRPLAFNENNRIENITLLDFTDEIVDIVNSMKSLKFIRTKKTFWDRRDQIPRHITIEFGLMTD